MQKKTSFARKMFRIGTHSLLGLCLLFIPALVRAEVHGFGPYPVRNFHPLQQIFLGMFGDRAAVVPPRNLDVRLELAETAAVFNEATPVKAQLKFETLRSALFFRYGVAKRSEVSVEIPLLYRYEGFLGGAITAVERATTGLAPERQALENIDFVFNVEKNGRTVFSGKQGVVGLGDISFIGKYLMVEEQARSPAVALRVGVKIPTGDRSKFFGSGHTDVGLGLAFEKQLATRWLVYANVNGVFPTGEFVGFELDPIFSGVLAVEYMWTPDISFVTQFDYFSTPYGETGANFLDRGVTEVTGGFNVRFAESWLWQVYGVENVDFIRNSSADFTLSTLFTYRFGG